MNWRQLLAMDRTEYLGGYMPATQVSPNATVYLMQGLCLELVQDAVQVDRETSQDQRLFLWKEDLTKSLSGTRATPGNKCSQYTYMQPCCGNQSGPRGQGVD